MNEAKAKKPRSKRSQSTPTSGPSDLAALLNRRRSLRARHADRMDPSRATLRALRQRMRILTKATTASEDTLLYYERPHVRAAVAAGLLTETGAILGFAIPSFGRSSGPGFKVPSQDNPSRQVQRRRALEAGGKRFYRMARREA